MKKRYAVITASLLFSATRTIHADVIDTFNRPDGSIPGDSIGLTETGPTKFAYSERGSPTGVDGTVNAAAIQNGQLDIFGTHTGAGSLALGAPGIVYLDGYNSADTTLNLTLAFDSGTLNGGTLISSSSLTCNTFGAVFRAKPNFNFTTPTTPTDDGLVAAEMGPNGDILIREVGPANTLVTIAQGNPFRPAANDRKIHPGSLPAMWNGLPFDVNQDGILEPDEPVSLNIALSGNTIILSVNGEQVIGSASLNFTGAVSGINGIALIRNRVASANTIYTNVLIDNLDITPTGSAPITASWNVDSDGSWTNGSNWTPSSPYGVDDVVNFGSIATSSRTVTLDAPQVAGTINFDNLNGYTLSAATSGTITMNLILSTSTGHAGINVNSGTQTIAAPLEVKSDTTMSVAANSVLACTGTLTAIGRTITKTGAGTVQFTAVRAGGLVVNAGTVQVLRGFTPIAPASTSDVSSLSIAPGAAYDLGNSDLVVDYSNGGLPDPAQLTAIRTMLRSAYANGAWTGSGLTSSDSQSIAADSGNPNKTALGYAEASAAGFTSKFDGLTVDNDAIVVRYTLAGDATLDESVNTDDFTALALNFGSQSGTWLQGDFNYDGVVNALDFNAIAANYGAFVSQGPALGSLVPEPTFVGMLGVSFVALQMRRRRD